MATKKSRSPRKTTRPPVAAGPLRKPRAPSTDWSRHRVADIMQKDVVTVEATMRLSEVERILSESRISGAPVTDESGHIIGVVSLRDLIEHHSQAEPATRQPRSSSAGFYGLTDGDFDDDAPDFEWPAESEETAADVMTAAVFSVAPSATLRQVAKEMVRHAIHRMLVTEKGHTIGIVSTTDLLRALAR